MSATNNPQQEPISNDTNIPSWAEHNLHQRIKRKVKYMSNDTNTPTRHASINGSTGEIYDITEYTNIDTILNAKRSDGDFVFRSLDKATAKQLIEAYCQRQAEAAVIANRIELANYIKEHLATGDLEQALTERLAELTKAERGV